MSRPSRQLNGHHFTFVTVEDPPFVIFEREQISSKVAYKGFCFEIINTLRSKLNFTYDVITAPDGEFGAQLSNGSWTGMIGMVIQKKDCHMGAGSFSVTFDRQSVVDFTNGFFEEPTRILIPPPDEATRLFACARPFQIEVWIGLLCVIGFLPMFIHLAVKLEKQFGNYVTQHATLSYSYIFVVGVLTTQSGLGNRLRGYFTSSALAALWCLISVILIYAYNGTWTSFLTVPKLQKRIYTLEDLPTSGLNWVVIRGHSLQSLFMSASDGIYKAIGNGLRDNPEMLTTSKTLGPQLVLNGSSAYIDGKSTLEFYIAQDNHLTGKCRFDWTRQEFFKVDRAFVLPKGSPLKSIFSNQILLMHQSGLIEYWRKQFWPSVSHCDWTLAVNKPRRLTLGDIQSPFLILAVGLGFAIMVLICENLVAFFFKK